MCSTAPLPLPWPLPFPLPWPFPWPLLLLSAAVASTGPAAAGLVAAIREVAAVTGLACGPLALGLAASLEACTCVWTAFADRALAAWRGCAVDDAESMRDFCSLCKLVGGAAARVASEARNSSSTVALFFTFVWARGRGGGGAYTIYP